jgi:hypothetical protein
MLSGLVVVIATSISVCVSLLLQLVDEGIPFLTECDPDPEP